MTQYQKNNYHLINALQLAVLVTIFTFNVDGFIPIHNISLVVFFLKFSANAVIDTN